MIELLSPVGDFECLKAAVQNGADAVYFGAGSFNARAFATNFDDDALEKAINYAKLRNVKTNLTLNTLIKNNEIEEAIKLAQKAYEYGIDAIIVQDLGLAKYLIKNFPDLAIHGSTQMSVHNLEGVLELEKMGFSRVVLSRELSLNEIEHICKNSNIEIEVFVHGALCISYSGQCLFSSIIGGRSGNRGKCAQPCRLPYELLIDKNNSDSTQKLPQNCETLDKGYILSPRDLCGLEFLPQLVKSGVSSLKIEGRMKTPEYVATVTRIYRKYLDLIQKNPSYYNSQNFVIEEKDKKDLLQVFNRGGFSSGHLKNDANKELIYKNKSNNMGIYLGQISNFNENKGHITFSTADIVNVGDKISIENKKHETSLYTISELMINNKNIKQAHKGDKIKIGRMKGNISVGDKIYKVSDKFLTTSALESFAKETRKSDLNCKLIVKHNLPLEMSISDNNGISVTITSDIIPVEAINSPITKERLITQISKTGDTPFNFKNFEINLDDNLYIPSISKINELRRLALTQYEEKVVKSFKRQINQDLKLDLINQSNSNRLSKFSKNVFNKKTSILLNLLNTDFDYTKLQNLDNIYIPFKYFILKDFSNTLKNITNKFNTYIYMPTIIKNNYIKLINANLGNILNTYKIKGFVLSNISNFKILENYKNNYEFICNYTFNIFNDLTINELNCNTLTLSPELDITELQELANNSNINTELIVYGKIPLMNSNYCLLGKTNKCYQTCAHYCNSSNKFYLKDRFGFLFRVIPDNIETVSTIYNSRFTQIDSQDIAVNSVRFDFIDETIDEINEILHN